MSLWRKNFYLFYEKRVEHSMCSASADRRNTLWTKGLNWCRSWRSAPLTLTQAPGLDRVGLLGSEIGGNDDPGRAAFLAGPISAVRNVAPPTVILAAGGTRRRAALDGVTANSPDYMQTARKQMLEAVDLLVDHGVRHVFVPILVDGNFLEQTSGYREKLLGWLAQGLVDEAAVGFYAVRGWRVRLVGAELLPELAGAAQILRERTDDSSERCVWFTAMPTSEAAWDITLRAALRHQACSRRDAILALYGRDIPADDVV